MLVASRVPQSPGSSRRPGTGGIDGVGAARDHDVLGRVAHGVDLDRARAGEPPRPPDEGDAPLREPALLPGVGPLRDHVVAPGECRLDVHLRARPDVARALHGLAGPEQRLGRDARPVGALAPDQLALDDGDPQAALGQGGRAVLAGGACRPGRSRRSRRSRRELLAGSAP